MEELPGSDRARVAAIGSTGQMHGLVLWNMETRETSSLITWQDQRCLGDQFLEELRQITGEASLQSGYGLVSLGWLARHESGSVKRFQSAGCIHDFVVSSISDSSVSVIDPSDAASWGFFDLATRSWKVDQIQRAGIDVALLPEVRPAGSVVGELSGAYATKWGIPTGVPVCNALGDNQASLHASLTDPNHQVALTIGTGAQLSVVVDAVPSNVSDARKSYEYRPYIGSSYIAVAASLSGGRALATLGRALEDFIQKLELKHAPTLDQIQSMMHCEGLQKIGTDVVADARLGGERHDPHRRGSITNLSFETLTIGDLTAALCRGLVTSLRDALPPALLANRREVVGSGNAIRRSALMQGIIREVFQAELVLTEGAEPTAAGAALLAAAALR
jgi:sedoheptulokinase